MCHAVLCESSSSQRDYILAADSLLLSFEEMTFQLDLRPALTFAFILWIRGFNCSGRYLFLQIILLSINIWGFSFLAHCSSRHFFCGLFYWIMLFASNEWFSSFLGTFGRWQRPVSWYFKAWPNLPSIHHASTGKLLSEICLIPSITLADVVDSKFTAGWGEALIGRWIFSSLEKGEKWVSSSLLRQFWPRIQSPL